MPGHRGAAEGGVLLARIPNHVGSSHGRGQRALCFPDPRLRFCAVSCPRWPWAQARRAPGAGADRGRGGPSLCSTCVSGEMACTSEPCPGTPCSAPGTGGGRSSGTRGDAGSFRDQPHGVPQWRPGEVGVQGRCDLVSHLPRPSPNTRYDSGLRLEPLDSVEPLQPQLQRGYPATLPGGHRAPSCLWGGSVPGPRHGG